MKKLIIGLAAIGAVLAVRPLVKRKAQTMREHCEQMAGKCKEMVAETTTTPSEEAAVAEPPEPTPEAVASA
jgi:hypothetical protein